MRQSQSQSYSCRWHLTAWEFCGIYRRQPWQKLECWYRYNCTVHEVHMTHVNTTSSTCTCGCDRSLQDANPQPCGLIPLAWYLFKTCMWGLQASQVGWPSPRSSSSSREGTQVESSIPELSRDVLYLYPPKWSLRYMCMELIEPPSGGEWHSSTSIPKVNERWIVWTLDWLAWNRIVWTLEMDTKIETG